jgi:hypothetical protein
MSLRAVYLESLVSVNQAMADGLNTGIEKVARVARPIKEYRRALQAISAKLPMHSTGNDEAASIAREGLLRTGKTNYYGRGTYWSTSGKRTHYGPSTIIKKDSSNIKSVGDPERPTWGLHKTEVGTPIGRGDTLLLSEGNQHYGGPARATAAARAARMRVIGAEPFRAADSATWRGVDVADRTETLRSMGSGSGKREFISSERKRDRFNKRLAARVAKQEWS